jgi:chromosome transmission fidelity protein 1
VTLGSRKNLCINDELRGLEGARLNEACLDLQDKASKERKAAAADGGSSDVEQSTKGTGGCDSATVIKSKRRNERQEKKRGGCPYLAGGEARQARVLDRLLVSPLEIEELAVLGRRENACPYYAARAALPEAQLVALPYASLLNSSTRQALGLRLAGSVVVIDEAHNLIDTINQMHSVTLSAKHLSETSAQLAQYEERYRARLKPANRQMVQQLLFVVRALRRVLLPRAPAAAAAAGSGVSVQAQRHKAGPAHASAAGSAGAAADATAPGPADERIVAVNSLLCSLNVDHINLLRLKAFCEASELAKKLQGFSEAQTQVCELLPAPAARHSRALFKTTSDAHLPWALRTCARARTSPPLRRPPHLYASLAIYSSPSRPEAPARAKAHKPSLPRGRYPAHQVQTASQHGQPGQAQRSDGVARCTLHPVIALLEALAHADGDARVLLHIEPATQLQPKVAAPGRRSGSWLRVLHLNPATYFASVLSEARAIVLCGGTMQPFDDFQQQLFRALPPGRVRTSAYDHIVPPKSLLPVVFGHGPGGGPLTFSFGTRSAPSLMDELGKLLLHVAGVVPDGVVVFVPSFQYEAQLVARWESTGLWARLDAVKKTFREPRAAADVEEVLAAYSDAIDRARGLPVAQRQPASTASEAGAGAQPGGNAGRTGPLLLSVVGGKMSEGINFSDRLGRCVVMVGLPYANPHELALQERMAHLEATQGKGAGREYYSNLCMKAVNQSIGRAIRHKGDFATIVLADQRFAKPAVRSRLPAWIAGQVVDPDSFESCIAAIREFFLLHPDP